MKLCGYLAYLKTIGKNDIISEHPELAEKLKTDLFAWVISCKTVRREWIIIK